MFKRPVATRVLWCLSIPVLMALLGQGCPPASSKSGGNQASGPVKFELINATTRTVNPAITYSSNGDVIANERLAPSAEVTITVDCRPGKSIGTHSMFYIFPDSEAGYPLYYVNPGLTEGDSFHCGDTLRFTFRDEIQHVEQYNTDLDTYWVEIAVNGVDIPAFSGPRTTLLH